jgi:hypothetical protein
VEGKMRSSDRRIVAARKIDEAPLGANDTWPAPPPSSRGDTIHDSDDSDERDTIPTPPPESGTADVVVVPPLRGVTLVDEERS